MGSKNKVVSILGENITITDDDYISLTDMLKAKEGDFFYFRLASQPQHSGVFRHLGADTQPRF
jgi:hypothetical protein